MPRLRLEERKGAFLDIRPVYRPHYYGLSVHLKVKQPRGTPDFVVKDEYRWASREELLNVLRRFILEGNLTIPGEPTSSGIQFRLQYKNDDISILKVSYLKNKHHAEYRVEMPTKSAWKFLSRLFDVCENVGYKTV